MYDIDWGLPNGHMAAPPPTPTPYQHHLHSTLALCPPSCRQPTVSFTEEMVADFHTNGWGMMGLMKINGMPGVSEIIVAPAGGLDLMDRVGGVEGVEWHLLQCEKQQARCPSL